MSAIARRYSTFIIVVLSIILGLFLPQVGLIWKPYLSFLLALLMFFVGLSIEFNEIVLAIRNYPVIATGLLTVFVVAPVLGISAKPFFPSVIYAGIILALCCPSAIVSAFWTRTFEGDIATALVMSITTNLLSIVTIPATMLIAVGTVLNVDVGTIMLNLTEIILVPIIASLLIRKFIKLNWNRVSNPVSKIELGILVLLIWGSISPGTEYVKNNITEFTILNLYMLGILAAAFTLSHLLSTRFGKKRAISLGIATTVKNAALSLVVGLTAFGPQIVPPLVANLIAQNLLLIPAKALLEERSSITHAR